MAKKETSRCVELLLSIRREPGAKTLGRQLEDELRARIRDGRLHAGAQIPSTRDLARQLGVSRRIVVDAYSQLSAEGYLDIRQGARPAIGNLALPPDAPTENTQAPGPLPLYDFRPSVPDVSRFPRTAWLRSLKAALGSITDTDLGYSDPRGMLEMRRGLVEYLGRVRGVTTDADRVVVTAGYTQGLNVVCQALAQRGARRVALEDPCNPEQHLIVARAGLTPIHIPVDEHGILVESLAQTDAAAVVVTPAHQHPLGAVLSSERRAALLTWLRSRDAYAIEDDYDAEYRYDRAAIGALQGLDPDRVIYAGSISKTLAPALRLGWLAVPHALVTEISHEKMLADQGSPRVDQLAFADFLQRGELDRHLRRMRLSYRQRRDTLINALEKHIPQARVMGIAAGLHVTLQLPNEHDAEAIQQHARERRVELAVINDFRHSPASTPPTLLLGYSRTTEPAIPEGIRQLAAAIHSSRETR